MIKDLATFGKMEASKEVRAVVLCSEGKHFCAGNNFGSKSGNEERADRKVEAGNPLYAAAVQLFDTNIPVVAAVQGAAVGSGFGLAVMPASRGFLPGGALYREFREARLPSRLRSDPHPSSSDWTAKAHMLFLTGRRITGEEAYEMGLADVLTDKENLRSEAIKPAQEIAENAPLAVASVRATMRTVLPMRSRHKPTTSSSSSTDCSKLPIIAKASRR